MSKSEVIGNCADCVFLEREIVTLEQVGGQTMKVEDILCGIFDVFVPVDGFCHMFELTS